MSPIVTTMSSPQGRVRRVKGPTPISGDGILFNAWQLDGTAGTYRVFGTYPAKPGEVTNTANVRVYDDTGVEQQIAVTALNGAFPDGSLRAVSVQLDVTLASSEVKTFYAKTNAGARGTTDLSYLHIKRGVDASPNLAQAQMANNAFLACMDGPQLRDSFVIGAPMLLEADDPEPNSVQSLMYSPSITSTGSHRWFVEQMSAGNRIAATGVATYPHMWAYFKHYVRATSLADKRYWFALAMNTAKNYYIASGASGVFNGIAPNRVDANLTANPEAFSTWGNTWTKVYSADATLPVIDDAVGESDNNIIQFNEAQMCWMIGVPSLYFLTGWDLPWRYIAGTMNLQYMRSSDAYDYATVKDKFFTQSETFGVRWLYSRNILPTICAHVMGATMRVHNRGNFNGRDNAERSWATDFEHLMDALAEEEATDAPLNGIPGIKPFLLAGDGKIGPFQTRLLVDALMYYYQNVNADSRIVTWITATADRMIGQMYWDGSLAYLPTGGSLTLPVIASDFTSGNRGNLDPSGNGPPEFFPPIIAKVFGAAYALTANSTYKTWVDRCARPVQIAGDGFYDVKRNGEYYDHAEVLHYRNGGSALPVSGAHPTVVSERPTVEP